MKILNKTSYITTILEVEYNNEIYTIRHAEDHDGYFVNEWEIFDEDGDMLEIEDELCDTLTLLATEHINGTNKSLIEASSIATNVYSPDAQTEDNALEDFFEDLADTNGGYDDGIVIEEEHASILAKELSSEQLNYQDFVDYICDYYKNPEEYNIHPDSSYRSAIVSAWHNTEEMYELYLSQFKK